MRFELMYESFFKIIEGIPLTLQVVSISTVLGLALAIIVALMRISGKKSMSIPAYYFVYLIRGTHLCYCSCTLFIMVLVNFHLFEKVYCGQF